MVALERGGARALKRIAVDVAYPAPKVWTVLERMRGYGLVAVNGKTYRQKTYRLTDAGARELADVRALLRVR